jgi:hypothetical protein
MAIGIDNAHDSNSSLLVLFDSVSETSGDSQALGGYRLARSEKGWVSLRSTRLRGFDFYKRIVGEGA